MTAIELINPNTEITIKNRELKAATTKIRTLSKGVATSLFKIAAVLNHVETSKCYVDDGFKSAADYAMKTFGFKKSMAYSLVKIGKEYTDTTNGTSNLPHGETDFTVSQIEKCLPLNDRETVVELVNEGEITPEMSCREIAKVVKSKMATDDDTSSSEKVDVEKVPEEPEMSEQDYKDIALHNAVTALNNLAELIPDMSEYIHNIVVGLEDTYNNI